MAHTVLGTIPDRGVCDILSQEFHAAPSDLLQSGQPLHQLCLSVAVDTRNTYDLTTAHLKRDIPHGIVLMRSACHRQMRYLKHRIPRLFLVLVNGKAYISAHHHLGKFFLRRIRDVDRSDVLSFS